MLAAPLLGLIGELRPGLGHDQLHRPAALVRRRKRQATLNAFFGKAPIVVGGSGPPVAIDPRLPTHGTVPHANCRQANTAPGDWFPPLLPYSAAMLGRCSCTRSAGPPTLASPPRAGAADRQLKFA